MLRTPLPVTLAAILLAALLAGCAGMSAPGRSQALIPEPFKGEGSPVSTPGRPKGEFRSAQHEGSPVSSVSSQVSSHGDWPTGRAPGTYAFDRLPSQQALGAETDRIEAAARPALQKAGFQPVAVGQAPDVLVQVGARTLYADLQPWGDPMGWRGGFGHPYSYGYGWRGSMGYGPG